MKTNLYHKHTESKDVRLQCDRIRSLENLWRGQHRSISSPLYCGARSTNNRGKLEIGQTSVETAINKNARLVKGYR